MCYPNRILYLILPFLFLSVFGCEKAPTNASEIPDSEKLLSDEDLLTPEDPNAPSVPSQFAEWIKSNHDPIRSLTSSNHQDLTFMGQVLQGNRIVQLGESGHGVKQFNLVKVRLIKYLHEKLGYDVLAFESSIFECYLTNFNQSNYSPISLMEHSIYGVWHTDEVLSLFRYLQETNSTQNPLQLAGFDTQMSSKKGIRDRPYFFKAVLDPVDSAYASDIFNFDQHFISTRWDSAYAHFKEYVNANKDSLISCYSGLVDFITTHETELKASSSIKNHVLIAHQTAWSMIQYIEQTVASYQGDDDSGYIIRDRGMADNLEFLVNELYPSDNVIVWAHNFHIRNNNQNTSYQIPSMGTWVHQNHTDKLYTIGLYMYRGAAATNKREIYSVTPAQEGSIESLFYRIRKKFSFVNLRGFSSVGASQWMYQEWTAKAWGTNPITMVPREQYDGILFIDTVEPPSYISGNGMRFSIPE